MSHFQQKLDTQLTSAFDLLIQLNELTGLVYLYDNHTPTIGFLPQEFLVLEQSELKKFCKTQFNKYKNVQATLPISDFLNFQSRSQSSKKTTFGGGYIGFFSYDYSANQFINMVSRNQPSFFLGLYSTFLKFQDDAWYFYSDENEAESIYQNVINLINQSINIQKTPFSLLEKCYPRWSKQQYLHAFNQVQEYIKAGDCYQINLTQEFIAKTEGSLLDRAQDLWALTHEIGRAHV